MTPTRQVNFYLYSFNAALWALCAMAKPTLDPVYVGGTLFFGVIAFLLYLSLRQSPNGEARSSVGEG